MSGGGFFGGNWRFGRSILLISRNRRIREGNRYSKIDFDKKKNISSDEAKLALEVRCQGSSPQFLPENRWMPHPFAPFLFLCSDVAIWNFLTGYENLLLVVKFRCCESCLLLDLLMEIWMNQFFWYNLYEVGCLKTEAIHCFELVCFPLASNRGNSVWCRVWEIIEMVLNLGTHMCLIFWFEA